MVYDKNFLLKLDKDKNKTIYARITALKFDESPIELIEGRVTQGSINIDGTSAVRRSCSLTIIAQDFDYRNYYWGLNTKFKLEIGLENHVDKAYPKICWFEQGIFLITSFNTVNNTTSFNISISGKDKMSQLNGEIGGNFESSVDFGQIEEQNEDGTWKIIKLPIVRIIREMIHQYAGEPYHNIIINGLEDYGLELLQYQYDTPMYLYRPINSAIFTNVLFDGNKECYVGADRKTLNDLTAEELDILVDTLTGTSNPVPVTIEGSEYYVAKVEYGQTAGYRMTDLVYAGDLIAAAGETVTSILDKIVSMLGEFEYFYDLKGQFIFQPKQSFVNTLWSPIIENENEEKYIESLATSSAHSYIFSEGELITAFNNNPNLTNVKNDYSIWGTRTSLKGTEVPIHMRYAIDQKPVFYKTIDGNIFTVDTNDWREIIYQMALDYYKYGQNEDFEYEIIKNNYPYYQTGQTGYESYYIDLQGFWRQLYDPNGDSELYYSVTDSHPFWRKDVYESPQSLNFWFDFLDSTGELFQFSVKNIGRRPKVVNDSNVKSIYFRETPDIIFRESGVEEIMTGYKYIQIPNIDMMFMISTQGKSAKDKLDELIYNHAYCIENATITSIPIYYLEPNTRIYLYNEKTNLSGDYIVSKFTIPLSYNGIMSITATKAAENIV